MIIQHRDGSYEVCPLPTALARLARALLRRVQAPCAYVRAGRAGAALDCEQRRLCGGGGAC